jgi:hypothetical protein
MRLTPWLLSVSLFGTSPLFAQTAAAQSMAPSMAPATAPTTAPVSDDEPDQVRLSVGRTDEYDEVIADLKIEGEQLVAFRAKNLERIAKLEAFVESDDGKQMIALREELAAARRDKQREKVAPLRAKITPLSDKYWAIRNQGRTDLLNLLTEDQLKRYAGHALLSRCLRGMEQIELSPEQKAQAREITNAAAAPWYKPGVAESDPYFRDLLSVEAPTRARIVAEVLTPEQRAKLNPRASTRPAAK